MLGRMSDAPVSGSGVAPEDDFKARTDAFFAGLRELVKRTGVALTTSASLGAWDEMQMVDAREGVRSDYLREDDTISWHRGGDYTAPEAESAEPSEDEDRRALREIRERMGLSKVCDELGLAEWNTV